MVAFLFSTTVDACNFELMKAITVSFYESLSTLEWILLGFLFAAFLIQLFYQLYFFVRIALWKHRELGVQTPPISIVICAKNEEENLRKLIPVLMDQDYPEFEVVIVNDNSWDDTEDILKAFQISYPNLHCIHLNEEKQMMMGKKFALTLGIKGAKHEQLVLSDADCIPSSNKWLRYMVNEAEEKDIRLGFSPYKKTNGLLNAMIRFDAFQTGLTYLSFAAAGTPYMGVGRNLSYTKSLFFAKGGFKRHYHIISGDDDLFIKENANKSNTGIVFHPDAQTISTPKDSWKAWWAQKRRHLTTAPHYKFIHKILLALYPLSACLLWLTGIIWSVIHKEFLIAAVLITLRYLIQFITFRGTMKRSNQLSLFWTSPWLEAMLWIINPVLWMSNLFAKPKQWK